MIVVPLRKSFLEKYKRNNGDLSRREVPADAIHLLRTVINGTSSPGSSWNTGKILPQFERPAIEVKGVRRDNVFRSRRECSAPFRLRDELGHLVRRLSINIHDAGQNASKAPEEPGVPSEKENETWNWSDGFVLNFLGSLAT